jgi:glycosyltransferase involved in cell wall biosynthesis
VRIQVLTGNNVYPPTFGGPQRVFHLSRALARGALVRVCCAIKSRERVLRRERVGELDIVRVKTYHPTVFHHLQRARLVPDYLDHALYRLLPEPLLGAADRAADIWHVEGLGLTGLFAHAPRGALKVYGSQNVEAEWFERVGPALLARGYWERRVAALERWAVERADLVLAVSEEDRTEFLRRYRADAGKVEVVENGFDPDEARRPSPDERASARRSLGLDGERALLFVGSDFPHNRVGVENLFRHLVPRLAALDARLVLVGSVSAPFAERAARKGMGRVLCLGVVADLRAPLWAADVALHPITTGAGSNLKLPTYLGAGLPVVSTEFGMRGFAPLAPYVTRTPVEGFGDVVARAPSLDPAVAGALAAYAWPAIGKRLLELYRERRGDARAGAAEEAGGGRSAVAAGGAPGAGRAACAC